MSEEMINVPMTREELRLLAFLLNRGVWETRDLQEMGLVEEASFVCRLVGAKAGNTVRWDEKLLRRLGKWVDEDPNGANHSLECLSSESGMTTLRSRTIRLAHSNPALRPYLLPMLKREAAGIYPNLPAIPPEKLAAVKDDTDAYGLAKDLSWAAFGGYPKGPNGELLLVKIEGVEFKVLKSDKNRYDGYVGGNRVILGKKQSVDVAFGLRDKLTTHWKGLIMKLVGVRKQQPSADEKETLRQLDPRNYVPGTRLLKSR